MNKLSPFRRFYLDRLICKLDGEALVEGVPGHVPAGSPDQHEWQLPPTREQGKAAHRAGREAG